MAKHFGTPKKSEPELSQTATWITFALHRIQWMRHEIALSTTVCIHYSFEVSGDSAERRQQGTQHILATAKISVYLPCLFDFIFFCLLFELFRVFASSMYSCVSSSVDGIGNVSASVYTTNETGFDGCIAVDPCHFILCFSFHHLVPFQFRFVCQLHDGTRALSHTHTQCIPFIHCMRDEIAVNKI